MTAQDRRKASKKLAELCLHNAEVLNKILRRCVELGIARYRIPSDIFPLITHPALNLEFNKLSASAKIKKSLRESGKIALDNNLGLSFHPSQFIVIASQNSAVRKNSAADINFNAEILDIMGIPATKSYPINIHINTAPNSFKFRENFENGLQLRTSLNLSHIVNKITDLNGASPIISDSKAQMEGYAINAFYGYQMDGLYQISDFTWQNNSDPNIPHEQREYVLKDGVVSVANYTAQPGDIKYADLNGDGMVTMEEDRTIIGKQFPDLTYAWQLNLEWKNFDFSMFWQGVQGINGYTYYEIACPFSGTANMGDWWLDYWTPDNPEAKYPRLSLDQSRSNIHSTFYMENASYLRLKNIELGYTFDKKLLSFMRNCTVRLYGNIQNAFTITNYKGFDPEMEVGETRAQAYPQVRIYTIGLNVNF